MQKNAKRITIIIPVYNVESYIEECIMSIRKQAYANLEIILIDDGSIDDSLLVCESQAKKDDRIRVFTKKNGGPSDARNYGITRSSGDYILFLDSDDALVDNSLFMINELLNDYEPDLLTYNYITNSGANLNYKLKVDRIYRMNDYLDVLGDIPWATWRSVYKASILKKNYVRFKKEFVCAEDCDFFMRCFDMCKKRFHANLPVVRYRASRDNSITNELKFDAIRSELMVFEEYYRKYDMKRNLEMKNVFARKYVNAIVTLYNLSDKKEIDTIVDEIKNNKDIIASAGGIKYLISRLIFIVFGYYNGSKIINKMRSSKLWR